MIETLGDEPVVVAHGRQMKNFVPSDIFLRRNPNLAAIRAMIARTTIGATGLTAAAPTGDRVIQTEPVVMSDGHVHGVQLWYGSADAEPPERPLLGAWKSGPDLTSSLTPQFLLNIGKDPSTEPLTNRAIADDIPSGAMNDGEAEALSWAVDLGPGRTFAANWGFCDDDGMYRRVGFCIRIMMEDGQLTGRSMNLCESVGAVELSAEQLAQRIIAGMARPGVYRAIIDLNTWTLIKWLDGPCPLYDWRAKPQMHPEDYRRFSAEMREELSFDQTSAVIRLPANGGGWTPIHITVDRIELDKGIFAGLVALRLPTADETA